MLHRLDVVDATAQEPTRLVRKSRGRFVTLPFPRRPAARRAARSPSERPAAPRRTPRTVFARVEINR